MSADTMWVLGHRIRPIETDDSYGMVEITSPPHVPGPPPHYHKSESEFLLIIQGTLNVTSNGVDRIFRAGDYVDLPPNTTHTFINNTEEDVVWVTGWRPKGFQKFFEDFGIASSDSGAREKSTGDAIVQKVVQNVERYGMYLAQ